MCVMYPAFEDSVFRKNETVIHAIDQELRSHLRAGVVSSPDRYSFPQTEFFDSIYHLNGHGRQLRTNRVIEDLYWEIQKHLK